MNGDTITNDEYIISLFLRRDERALKLLSERYGRYLRVTASNFFKDPDDISDCVNDTYISVWDHIPPDHPVSLKGYITKIIRNISIDKHRQKRRQKRVVSEFTSSIDELAETVRSTSDVEKEYDAIRIRELLNAFVKGLDKSGRYIFVCRYYNCDSVSAIARSLGKSNYEVNRELTAIKEKLKERLKEEGLENE